MAPTNAAATRSIERFGLDPHKKARTYSKGNRQKVALVAAFATDAELCILDEPTSGLDPSDGAGIRECVAEVARRGAAVLLSSHILAEVEKLCDTVTIIRAGRTVQSGSLAQLRHLMRTTVTVRTRGGPARPELAGGARRGLRAAGRSDSRWSVTNSSRRWAG